MSNTIPENKCTIQVRQARRNPSKSETGVRRRPWVIKEIVAKWYHRCDWCNEWFKPARSDQVFCCSDHRHAAFRERRRQELVELRRRVAQR
jgi:hypothetical protein